MKKTKCFFYNVERVPHCENKTEIWSEAVSRAGGIDFMSENDSYIQYCSTYL